VRWHVHGERVLYDSEWVRLALVDVEVPGGERFDHHVVRIPNHASGTVVHDRARASVLLLWRHRFITDSWGWEIPAGGLEPGEDALDGAVRETIEETGWRPEGLRPLVTFHPANGISDQTFHTFVADRAVWVGEPSDMGEAERVEWVPTSELRRILRDGEMRDGLSLTAITYALAFGELDDS
jgi:8-oxo-dGTP pyrophosphatase MutT (NUDIX family)